MPAKPISCSQSTDLAFPKYKHTPDLHAFMTVFISSLKNKFLRLLVISIFAFSTALTAQVFPANENFNGFGGANNQTSTLVPFANNGKFLVFTTNLPTVTPGTTRAFLGNPGATLFPVTNATSSDRSFVFNYSNTGAIPASGQPGNGDYRIKFCQSSNDTTTGGGNFRLIRMYMAIGHNNTGTVTIKAFRAGRVISQGTVIFNEGVPTSNSSTTDIDYSTAIDGQAGLTLSFGTNWEFLDAIIIQTVDTNIPVLIDGLEFATPTTVAPTSQASSASFTPTGITSAISWTNGSGDFSAVFMAAASSGSPTITNATDYTANTVFGSGTAAGAGWFCVYNGKGTSENVTGLSAGTTYRFKVVSYNGNTGFGEYKTTEGSNITNFPTIAIPATQASSVTVTSITGTTATLSWTAGTGPRRAVFVNLTSTGTAAPVHNTNYTASTNVNSGTQIGSTGWRCVYNGTGTTENITNLTAGQTYRVMVTEYNDNGLGSAFNTFNTNTATGNPVNFTMDNVPVATTSAANSVSHNSVFLTGSIIDMGDNTGTSFQYSTNSGLATPSTVAGSPLTVTAGTGFTAITGALSGLNPSTTYYYRIRGINAVGTTDGAILNFTTSPVINSVTATNTNGSYKAGDLIVVTVTFSSAVTVTGTPTITLNSGSVASYSSGSGTTTLNFNYTVAAGENSADLDYTSTTALNGGLIKDAFGNNASAVLPTVGGAGSLGFQKNIVIDTQIPTLSVVTIASNNTTSTLAKVGDIVTLNFTSFETIVTPTVTIANHAISATFISGNNWKVDYTMVSGDATGVITFSIPFSDLVGNAGTTVSATTNVSSVTFDKINPTLTPVAIISNNTVTTVAKTGHSVSLSFTSGETIAIPTATIAGHALTPTSLGGNNWVAVYTMLSSDNEGVIPFTISFSDLAGNTGTVSATTNSSSVTFDKTLPLLTSVSIASNNVNPAYAKAGEIVTVTFTANETIATPAVVIGNIAATVVNTGGNNWAGSLALSTQPESNVGFNISFSDIAGNIGASVIATTNSSSVIYDKTPPVLQTVSIASNNINTAYAKPGDVVTLSFTTNETIGTPTVTIAGNTVTAVNTSGNNWTATRTMSTETAGTVTFSISFADLAGNAGSTASATTNSTAVTFDKTAPSITNVTIVSNNTNPALGRSGDIVTINFTSSEPIKIPDVTVGAFIVTATNTGGNNWSVSSRALTSEPEGLVIFNIPFQDLAGNAGTAVTATTNSSNVFFDKTNPVISSLTIASNNSDPTKAKVGDVVTINLTASEPIKTPSVTIASHAATTITNTGANNWSATYTMTSADLNGTVAMQVSVSDLASNNSSTLITTTNSSSVVFDKTTPQLSTVTISSSNNSGIGTDVKAGDFVVLAISASEPIDPPVVTIAGHVVAVSGTPKSNWNVFYTIVAGDAEGIIPFNIAFKDPSGNQGTPVTATTNSSSVKHDKTAPLLSSVTIASSNAISTRAKIGDVVTVTFVSNETLRTPLVRIAGRPATVTNTSGNTWTGSYTMTSADANATVTLQVDFLDIAGNAGVSATATTNNSSVVFDKLPPILQTVTIASNNINFPTRAIAGNVVTVSFTATEAILTPTATIAGKPATVVNTSGNNWTASYTLVAADPAGSVAFNILCTDILGNVGTAVTTTTNAGIVTHDKTAPLLTTVTITSVGESSPSRAKVGSIISITVLANETIHIPVVTIAGITATSASPVVGTSWNFSATMTAAVNEGVIPFNISFGDVAGVPGITVTTTTNNSSVILDKTAPVLTNVTIASNNADPSRAKVGDIVTLSYTASEPINSSVIALAGFGFGATNTGGNSWKVSYTMRSTDAEGVIPFSISFRDVYGNNGTQVTATTNNSSVVFDKTNPSLIEVSISSNYANPLLAKPGDIVTLNFTASEVIAIPSVTLAGQTVAITTSGNNKWIATYTMTGNDSEGIIPFSIIYADLTGNAGGTITTTTNSSDVFFDKADPSVNSIVRQLPAASIVNGATVTYRVSFSEPVSGVSTSSFLLTTSGATTATIASVSPVSGSIIDVTVNGISGNGTLRLDLKSIGTAITDAVGKTTAGGFASGETYTINQSVLSFPAGSAQTLALCVGAATPTSLDNMLRVNGADNGLLLTWTVISGPSHGTLNGFAATATVTGAETMPSALSYLATNGYTGTDAFTIQVSDGIVTATASVAVTVNALPVVTITSSQGTILCGNGATLPVKANGGNTYNWYNNGSLIPGITGAQLTVSTIGSYTAKAIDAVGCSGAQGSAIVISQLQKPTVAFSFTTYCIGKPISFINQSVTANSGQISYLWNDGNNNTSTSASPAFTYNQPAVYNVKLKITPTACPSLADSLTKPVNIDVPAAAIRMPTMNVATNDRIPLQARTFGTAYLWSPSTGLSSVNTSGTTATIASEQQYTVAISVASGCVTVDTLLLKAFVANDLLVPNIFSPNNDGQNDKLFVNLVGIKTLQYFRVFNRYGKKIFETANLGEGWDGKLNGVPQPVDTYIWTAMGVTREGAPIYREGTITLVR
ncbi:MAG: gliding motility-associated C-terminal domain-containing protein [Bacteroidota bacterium]